MAFGADTTTDEVIAGIDLRGKQALVTGASTGLGEETARALASAGAAVTLAVRDKAKGEAAAERIRKVTGNQGIDVAQVELSVPDSVRACAKTWLAGHGPLHLLVNNAGVMACPLTRTAEGWEMQFATNHLGHFLLTNLLAPALKAGAPGRIVNLSSAGHRFADVNFVDPHFNHRDYDKWSSYGQSKTANVLFSVELTRRLAPYGITANAVHPGGIQTELGRHLTDSDIEALMARVKTNAGSGEFKFKTIPAGAATSVWAATSPELEGRGGLYLEDCHVGELKSGPAASSGYFAYATDPASAARLWALSEATLGETFDLG
ncbi:SDR family NAD(P)-dependent oxidoreductase [Emcibacter sp. SYSU 3D8]|uniref:SDR family NAD(P)-dependent oxidoreductase n=1 Tax=Emcibacter sp. SYSU 3D8 TaxID=3133969 RepID=UPI0031FE9CDF